MNWSYQGTKACTVLVGNNGDGKSSLESKNSSSVSSTSSPGRSRTASSGGNHPDIFHFYSRKRRDTNQHDNSHINNYQDLSSLAGVTVHDDEGIQIAGKISTASDAHDESSGFTNLGDGTSSVSVFYAYDFPFSHRSTTTEIPPDIYEITELSEETSGISIEETTAIGIESATATITSIVETSLFESNPEEFDKEPGKLNVEWADRVDQDTSENILKDTAELPDQLLASEIEVPSQHIDKPEQPQQDYLVPVFTNVDEAIEIVDLDEKKPTTMSKNTMYNAIDHNEKIKNLELKLKTNDVKELAEYSREVTHDDLESIVNEGSDEGFLREFNRRFREHENELLFIDNELFPQESLPKLNQNSPHISLHDSHTWESESSILNSNKREKLANGVSNIKLPGKHRSLDQNTRRLLINVSIFTEDQSSLTKPIYVLSVSVPSDGNDNNIISGINMGPAQLQETNKALDVSPPPQPPAQPPPVWGGGECECLCPCMETSSDEWDNFPADNNRTSVDEILTKEGRGQDGFRDIDDGYSESSTEGYSSRTEGLSGSTIEESETFPLGKASTADFSFCTTPLPPEPTILILEGEVDVLQEFWFIFSYSRKRHINCMYLFGLYAAS